MDCVRNRLSRFLCGKLKLSVHPGFRSRGSAILRTLTLATAAEWRSFDGEKTWRQRVCIFRVGLIILDEEILTAQ